MKNLFRISLLVYLITITSCVGVKTGSDQVRSDQAYYNYEAAMNRARKAQKELEKELKKETKKDKNK